MLIVQKFGGSSLAEIDRLRRAAEICIAAKRREHDIVAVVSAMGDTTDELIELAQQISPRPSAREMDVLTTTGEQQSAALMAIMLESLGTKARSLTGWQSGIFTDDNYGSGKINLIAPSRIEDTLSEGIIPVVTGFQGFCAGGDITSLGRGGSDTTAVALAAALDADRCEIYTDVDGIYTADPRVIPSARKLEKIDFRDMLALAEGGSQVLHPRSVEIAMVNGVDIHLLSSFNPGSGSIVSFLRDRQRPEFAGITGNRECGDITLVGPGCDAGTLSDTALMLAAEGIAIQRGSIGENRITVSVSPAEYIKAMTFMHDRIILK